MTDPDSRLATTTASRIFRPGGDRKHLAYLSGGSGLFAVYPDVMAHPSKFEPGRRVEYAVADRAFALAAALICLLLLAVAGVEGVRRGRMVSGLADGLALLFRPFDTAWALGLGLISYHFFKII